MCIFIDWISSPGLYVEPFQSYQGGGQSASPVLTHFQHPRPDRVKGILLEVAWFLFLQKDIKCEWKICFVAKKSILNLTRLNKSCFTGIWRHFSSSSHLSPNTYPSLLLWINITSCFSHLGNFIGSSLVSLRSVVEREHVIGGSVISQNPINQLR